MSLPIELALVALFVPAAMAVLLALVPPLRRTGRPAAWLSVLAATVSLGAAVWLFADQLAHPTRDLLESVAWLPHAGASMADVGLRIDGISVGMTLVVTLVAFSVQVFSLDYMRSEPDADLGRYFAYHSFFIFSMLMLVLAPNLLQLFFGWELVGLTSYLLIGFYFKKPSAAKAAVKAFWVTKLADTGLLLALLVLYSHTGGFEWTSHPGADVATLVTLLLFVAVVGKSAQFPLHVWLPDAMEGPTPVSALLHAATMVAAGVYLIVRTDPLFAQAALTREVMVYIGSFTAIFAAVIACVQTDIKKVLAYSTCSQLGYMVAALGAGSVMGGYFHLTTHAFFKALLFLGAGSVIHAVHSNEMSDMGGLWGRMKLTGTVFLVGSISLAGMPFTAGFFSKDLILESMLESGRLLPWLALLGAAFLTAFYMGRVFFLVFLGKRSEKAEHAHEGGWEMRLPLVLLAIPALLGGYFGAHFAGMWHLDYEPEWNLQAFAPSLVPILGFVAAWSMYGRGEARPAPAMLAPIARLARSGALDHFYEGVYRVLGLKLAAAVGFFDRYIVDGLINLAGYLTLTGGQRVRRLQSGNVRDYVFVVAFAIFALSAFGMLR